MQWGPVCEKLLYLCQEDWSVARWRQTLEEQQQDSQALEDTIAELQRHIEELQCENKELKLKLKGVEQQQR